MARPHLRADAVVITQGGVARRELREMIAAVRGVSGVTVRDNTPVSQDLLAKVSGLNTFPGTGSIKVSSDGSKLQYRAPASTKYGRPTDISAGDGSYTIEDGENIGAYLVVKVLASFIVPGQSGAVYLQRKKGGQIATTNDIESADAGNGTPQSDKFRLANWGPSHAHNVRVWVDPASHADFEVSYDDVTYVRPTAEYHADALVFDTIESQDSAVFYVQYGNNDAGPSGGVLSRIRWSWSSHN